VLGYESTVPDGVGALILGKGDVVVASLKELLAPEFIRQLTEDELQKLAELEREEVYEVGEVLFTEGSIAKDLYVVEEGRVALDMNLSVYSESGEYGTVDILTRGDVFGWSALRGTPVTMTARALDRIKVIAVDGDSLYSLFDENPYLGFKVMEGIIAIVSSRLRHMRLTLANVLSIASHDLKAPLAAVQSYLGVIIGGYAGEITDKQKEMLQRSSIRIKGFIEMIDNILDMSRFEAGKMDVETLQLAEVIEDSVASVAPLAQEKGVEVEVAIPGELPQVRGSSKRLQQVVTNLVSNAIKFTPAGGKVSLGVRVTIGHVEVDVADTGAGISAEDLPNIFQDFYRGTHNIGTGVGLGLSIARKIVEGCGGKIWAQSPCHETGAGSKFIFTLPKHLPQSKTSGR
jgi:signal transduction histidine kinase